MTWHALLLICGLAVVAGVLLYLPFFVWFRWRNSRRPRSAAVPLRVTGAGLCLHGAAVLILFAGLAMGHLAPRSWFGAQMRTLFGGFGYMAAVGMATSALERILIKRGFVFSYRTSALTLENSPSKEGK